ncbi:hypothetical protein RI367_005623 [Sorochytrium milnesiophthora]
MFALRNHFRAVGTGRVQLAYHAYLPVALVQLDNAGKHNALSGKMMAQLADCVDTLQEHADKLGFVIVTGRGSFCAGLDLGMAKDRVATSAAGKDMSTLMHDTLTRLQRLPLVSFAAIEGYALGLFRGGAELSVACDFRVVTYGSIVRFVHLKMGASPAWGGGTRLERLLGPTRALQLLLSCRKLSGQDAVDMGFAQHIAPSGEAVQKAVDVVETWLGWQAPTPEASHDADSHDDQEAEPLPAGFRINVPWLQHEAGVKSAGYSGHSLHSVRAFKTVIRGASDASNTDEALARERDVFAQVWGTPENLAAVQKALAKN